MVDVDGDGARNLAHRVQQHGRVDATAEANPQGVFLIGIHRTGG